MSQFFIVERTCYRRREETSLVRRFLLTNGWTEAQQVARADLVVFFACSGLRVLADEKLTEILATSKQLKPGAELVVGGCLPGMDGERLRSSFKGKTITPTDFSALGDLTNIHIGMEAMPRIWGAEAACPQLVKPSLSAAMRRWAEHAALDCLKFVIERRPVPRFKQTALRLQRRNTLKFSVAAGCSRRCAYCAKPFASGPVRSKPMDAVMKHISAAIRLGYRAFDLYADSLGAYGLDQNVTLGDLLDRILAIRKRFSVGLFDVHPQDFIRHFDRIERLCRAGKLHYIYVAVQSGSARVLKLMKRPCNVEDLAGKLIDIRQYPHVFMQSGIIAGFPGETDEEFEATLRLLERINFDNVYVHYYCDMPNTESSRLVPKVDKTAMLRRFEKIKRAAFKHNLAATRHEWEYNLALAPALEKQHRGVPNSRMLANS